MGDERCDLKCCNGGIEALGKIFQKTPLVLNFGTIFACFFREKPTPAA
jgi:hypothetical protein